jgi:transposase
MEAVTERAAGLDVHRGSAVACVIVGAPGHRVGKGVRTFGATARDLAALGDRLLERGVTHVGVEATGVSRQPVHAALGGAFTLVVGNASRMRDAPGRETDAKDAGWIADLVRHGPVRASFVPPPEVRRPGPPPRGAGRHAGGRARPHPRAARERRDQARRRDERRVRRRVGAK